MHLKKLMVAGGMIGVLAACGGSGGSGGSAYSAALPQGNGAGQELTSGGQVEAKSLSQGDSISITPSASNDVTIDFGESVDASEEYYLVLSTAGSSASSVSVTASTAASDSARELVSDRDVALDQEDDEYYDDIENNPVQQDFHDFLREEEAKLPPVSELQMTAMRTRAMGVKAAMAVGDTQSFHVLNALGNSSSCTTVTAEAKLITQNFILMVDRASPLTQEQIDSYKAVDDAFTREIALLGEPADVDHNGKVFLLLTKAVNEIGNLGNGGGFVIGFNNGSDEYPGINPCSNGAEILYLNVPDPTAKYSSQRISDNFWMRNIQPSVGLHELQHLISFTQHVFVNRGSVEQTWLNEGLSHFVEDNAAQNFKKLGLENPSRVMRYLDDPSQVNLFGGPVTIAARGGAYLFIRYLYTRAETGTLSGVKNGNELLSGLAQSAQVGIDNIEGVTGEPIEELFNDFAMTLAIDGMNLTSEALFQLNDFSLHYAYDDTRGTVLNGARTVDFSGVPITMAANAMTVVKITGQDILDNNGAISLNGSAGSLRAHLVRIQ